MDLSFSFSGRRAKPASRAIAMVLSFFLAACGSLVEVVSPLEVAGAEAKLAVHSFISPQDTLIRVYVLESVPIFSLETGNERQVLRGASVKLDGIPLPFDSTLLAYTIRPSRLGGIKAGNTYHLVVEEGNRRVEARTTVPEVPAAISSYRIDTSYASLRGNFSRQDTTLAVQFSWPDPAATEDYYRVSGTAHAIASYLTTDENGKSVVRRGQVTIALFWDDNFGRSEFQSDVNANGGTMQSPTGRVRIERPVFYTNNGVPVQEEPPHVTGITLNLHRTDRHYFQYHRTIDQHEMAADNPFAEPVLVYSNVIGGLGVFASYNSFSIVVKP